MEKENLRNLHFYCSQLRNIAALNKLFGRGRSSVPDQKNVKFGQKVPSQGPNYGIEFAKMA